MGGSLPIALTIASGNLQGWAVSKQKYEKLLDKPLNFFNAFNPMAECGSKTELCS